MVYNNIIKETGFSIESIKELEEIDNIIEENLEATKDISDTFSSMSEEFYNNSKMYADSINDNDSDEVVKEKLQESAANYLVGKTIEGSGNIINAFKTKNISDSLLIRKKVIAKRFLPRIDNALKRAESLCDKNQKIFIKWTEADINENFETKANNLNIALNVFRKSLRNFVYLTFLKCEYKAWNNGKHDNDEMERPTMEMVNNHIINNVLYPMSQEDINNGENISKKLHNIIDATINGRNARVDSRLMYIIMDSQLLSSLLSNFDNATLIVENKKKIHPFIMNYLVKNDTYKQLTKLKEISDDNDGSLGARTLLYYLNAILFTAIVVVCMTNFIDWVTWLEWTVGIILSLIGFVKANNAVVKAADKYNLKKKYIDLYTINCMRKQAGYEPKRVTLTEQLEKANAAIALGIIGAIIGFFFIPIPGGLVLGALIGAGMAGSSTENKENETDGSEYESIYYGSVWKGVVLNLILLVLLIYMISEI